MEEKHAWLDTLEGQEYLDMVTAVGDDIGSGACRSEFESFPFFPGEVDHEITFNCISQPLQYLIQRYEKKVADSGLSIFPRS